MYIYGFIFYIYSYWYYMVITLLIKYLLCLLIVFIAKMKIESILYMLHWQNIYCVHQNCIENVLIELISDKFR